MKKKFLAAAMVLLLALSLAACGGSAKGGGDSSASQSSPAGADRNGFSSTAWDASAPEAGEWVTTDDAPRDALSNGAPENAKIIYKADLELETKEFDQAGQALTTAVTELGGYFESRSLSEGGRYRSMDCVVRIPVENFASFLDRAGEAAHTTYRHEYSDDVSEAYYDSEARLTTQRTKLARLQELLSQAEDMADIITIESAISDTELEIEYLTGSLRKYDSLINYSTVNLNLYEVYRLSTDEEVPMTFGQRFTNAFLMGFQNGLAALDDLVISIARNWLTLLIWAAVIVIVILVVRRYRKRKQAAKIAAAIPGAPAAKPEEGGSDKVE